MTNCIDAIVIFNSHLTQRGAVAECGDYGKCKYDCKLKASVELEVPVVKECLQY